jgi:hypothetical protein
VGRTSGRPDVRPGERASHRADSQQDRHEPTRGPCTPSAGVHACRTQVYLLYSIHDHRSTCSRFQLSFAKFGVRAGRSGERLPGTASDGRLSTSVVAFHFPSHRYKIMGLLASGSRPIPVDRLPARCTPPADGSDEARWRILRHSECSIRTAFVHAMRIPRYDAPERWSSPCRAQYLPGSDLLLATSPNWRERAQAKKEPLIQGQTVPASPRSTSFHFP